jgi:iron complex transport system substrate-binding protein
MIELAKLEIMKTKNLRCLIIRARLNHSDKEIYITGLLFIITLFFISGFFLTSAIDAQTRNLTDDLGHTLQLSGCPERIISLAPNLTEILFALDLDEEIIGVTRFCDFPLRAQTKEIIGGLVDPSLEKIKMLRPDLILGFRGNPKRMVEKLHDQKLPVFVFESGKDFNDLFQLIRRIGQLTCREVQAERLYLEMNSRLQNVDSVLSEIKTQKKIFITLYGQGAGLWTCGRDSYLNNLLLRARVKNIASSVRGNWFVYNREKLVEDNPEMIFILCQNHDAFEKAKSWFLSQTPFQKIRAVVARNFVFLDENLFSRFGPRLVEAYEKLVRTAHPELFLDRK